MRQDVTREFEGVVVSWESSQDKYWKGAGVWTGTKQAKKFGEDLSLSDYQEAAKVHADPRRREKFKTNRLMNSVRPACTSDGGIIPLQELLWGVYLQASARGMLLILKKVS